MRKPHLLKKNDRVEYPREVIFVDTETRFKRISREQIRHEFHLGVALYIKFDKDGTFSKTGEIKFTHIDEFWDFVDKRLMAHSHIYIVSHNFDFDGSVLQLFSQTRRIGLEPIFAAIDQGCRLIRFRGDNRHLTCVNNAALFGGKLQRWGELIGLEKLPMPAEDDDEEKWFTYCERDVAVMVRLWSNWINFLRENDLGSMRFTIASQSMQIYRHKFMDYQIFIHDNIEAIRLERMSYHGGRVEPFRLGVYKGEPYYKLDVNSMYPHVMRSNDYPVCLDDIRTNLSIAQLAHLLKNHALIADVRVSVNEDVLIAPVNGRNCFVTGEFDTVLTTPELQYCLEHDGIRKIRTVLVYRKRPIFRNFVDYFYAMKIEAEDEGNELKRNIAKLILNSLYGKFGQRGKETIFCELDDNAKAILDEINADIVMRNGRMVKLGDFVMVERDGGESYNSFPAIAAHVTAYARMMLFQLIATAGKENVFYVDTDSLITNERGYENLKHLVDSRELGKLKVEGVSHYLEIYSPKDYKFGDDRKRKGIPKNAREVAENEFEVVYWPKLMSRFNTANDGYYSNRIVIKKLSYQVNWGILDDDNRIRPYRLPLP
jgi:hypothetical protein